MSATGWSLSEARSLAVKAARGGGYDWGLAEEAGFAVEWLQARSGAGVTALAALLDEGARPKTCPLRLGAALSDGGVSLEPLETVAQPLLLAPFVAVSFPQKAHRIIWEGGHCDVGQSGIVVSGDALCRVSSIRFELLEQAPDGVCASRVLPEAKAAMRRLAIHAHATYAPATEASRLAGAGAGLNDND